MKIAVVFALFLSLQMFSTLSLADQKNDRAEESCNLVDPKNPIKTPEDATDFLFLAVDKSSPACVRYAVKNGALFDNTNWPRRGKFAEKIDKRTRPDGLSYSSTRPADFALDKADLSMLRLLYEMGARPSSDAICFASAKLPANNKGVSVMQFMVEEMKLNVNGVYGADRCSLLEFAANNRPILDYLVSKGADPNKAVKNALIDGNFEGLRYLHEQKNADLSKADLNTLDLTMNLHRDSAKKIARYLIKNGMSLKGSSILDGVPFNTFSGRGGETNHNPFWDGDLEFVKFLLNHGADAKNCRATDGFGSQKALAPIKLLVERGMDPAMLLDRGYGPTLENYARSILKKQNREIPMILSFDEQYLTRLNPTQFNSHLAKVNQLVPECASLMRPAEVHWATGAPAPYVACLKQHHCEESCPGVFSCPRSTPTKPTMALEQGCKTSDTSVSPNIQKTADEMKGLLKNI